MVSPERSRGPKVSARGGAILALDQGTTGTTVLVLDRRARVVGRAYEEVPPSYPRPGLVEHDAEGIADGVLRTCARALRTAGLRGHDVAAVGITNQRETVVLWDRATGRPVTPAIVWQDRRTAPACAALRRRGLEAEVRRSTGLVLDPYFSATKVGWLLDHVRGLRRRAARGEIAFGTIDAWVLWRLTGGAVHATDPTNASRTLLFDLRRRRWSDRLLALFRVPREVLPRVLASSARFGTTARVGPFPAGIPITGVAGDQQAALFGQGCLEAGEAKCTYGTGAFLLVHTGTKPVASRHGLLSTVAVGRGGRPGYALEGSVFVAGAAVQWLRDGLGLVRHAGETEAIARRTPDAGGVHVVPAFTGLGAPWWDAEARGAVLGITRGTTADMLVRATLESIAFQVADLAAAMERDAAIRIRRLRVVGGATANDWLMQFQADVLGCEVARPAMLETTALGAGFLAGMGAGIWSEEDVLSFVARPEHVFRPTIGPAERRRMLAGWHAAVDRVRTRRA